MYFGNDKPNDKPVNVYVKPARRDGKHLVTLCFHAKKLRKIMTPEQVEVYRNDAGYTVIASR